MIRLEPVRGVGVLKDPTPEERTIMQAHRRYVELLATDHRLVLTGLSPGEEDVHGMVIVAADSEEDARRIMNDDPFIASGMMMGDLRPFRTVLMPSQ